MGNNKEVRLIDANALKETLKDLCSGSNRITVRRIEDCMLHDIFPRIIDDEPTIEVTQVLDKLKEKIQDEYRKVDDNVSYHYRDPDVAEVALQDAYENVLSWINEITDEGDDSE